MLVSNLGSGSLNVPGLQAQVNLGIQIIDIIKVVRLYIPSDIPLTNSSPENKGTRPTAKSLWHVSYSSWIQYGRRSEIRSGDVDSSSQEDLQSFTQYVPYSRL